ncbi:MAG: tail fiber domain-containing protein [Bacteroidia bacterium]
MVLQWAPGADDGVLYSGSNYIDITGNVITNTGDTSNVNEIQSLSLSGTTIFLSNGGGSVPLPYAPGTGISFSGGIINNTGDTNAADDITTSTAAAGDVSGTFPTLTVDGLQGTAVSAVAPITGEYLTFNGTNWLADSIETADIKITTDLLPANNTFNLGGPSNLWLEVFASNGVINTSDYREKNSIEGISYGMSDIMKLRPVSFRWNQHPELGLKLGLIAQEVEPVISEVVKTHQYRINPETGLMEQVELNRYGINYTDLIPVIIKGMQEQQDAIDNQQKTIETQQELIQKMEERIRLLEEKLK